MEALEERQSQGGGIIEHIPKINKLGIRECAVIPSK